MAGAGHVAAGSVPRRRPSPVCQPALEEVAAARHGLRDRLFGPAQIMRRSDSRLCVRRGRPKAEQAEEIIVPCSNDRSSHPTPGGKNFFG